MFYQVQTSFHIFYCFMKIILFVISVSFSSVLYCVVICLFHLTCKMLRAIRSGNPATGFKFMKLKSSSLALSKHYEFVHVWLLWCELCSCVTKAYGLVMDSPVNSMPTWGLETSLIFLWVLLDDLSTEWLAWCSTSHHTRCNKLNWSWWNLSWIDFSLEGNVRRLSESFWHDLIDSVWIFNETLEWYFLKSLSLLAFVKALMSRYI